MAEEPGRVLRAPVGVDDGPGLGAALPAGHLQGVDDELGADVVRDRPADDASGERVHDGAAVDPSVVGAVLGDVGEPHPIRRLSDELALDEVVVGGRLGLPVAMFALVADPAQASDAHQARDALTAADQAEAEAELGVDPRRAVGAARVVVDLHDRLDELLVGDLAGRRWAAAPLVVAGPRHL